tara:strand:+ start:811 stop:1002 length:192 start_codon:yes stop_codon:yes gene_type:complete
MQYWKNFKNGRVERVEEDQAAKHPELIDLYTNQGYVRVMSEDSDELYAKPKKRIAKKKKKNKK